MDETKADAIAGAGVRLEPLREADREALRAAATEDPDIWEIYSTSLLGEHFDRWWSERSAPGSDWRMFTIHHEGRVVGMTGYAPDHRHPGVAELGSSYLVPGVRGSGLNRRVKWLMLSHLFALEMHRVEFRVDARNLRSRSAVLKLGAVEEGVLRRHKITHTGFIRDTHVFAITDSDWLEIEPRLRPAAVSAPAGGESSN